MYIPDAPCMGYVPIYLPNHAAFLEPMYIGKHSCMEHLDMYIITKSLPTSPWLVLINFVGM